MVPLKLDYELPAGISKKFGLMVADEMLSAQEEIDIMATARRDRSKATGLIKPDYTRQRLFVTRPPAVPKLPPLHFPGNDGAEANAEQVEERKDQWEVDVFYAAPQNSYGINNWHLTKEGETTTLEQYDATANGSEPSAAKTTSCGWRPAS
jgi:hypothetical protein